MCLKAKRKDTQVRQLSGLKESVTDEAVYKEMDGSLRRVKKLEKKQRSRTYKLKRLHKVGLTARVESSDDEQSLGEDASKQGRINLYGEEVFVAKQDENVVKKEADAAQVQVNFRIELVEESSKKAKAEVMEQESSKRARIKLEQESSKKQKIDNKETVELKQLVKIILDEKGVAIDDIPLAVKPPSIVDWKIHKEGKKSYYRIIRVDGSLKLYLVFSHMLKSFDRENVETLWKLVKAKNGSTRPDDGYKRVMWGDLKVMFDPHVEDEVWKMQ
uniref:Uncharacterized protein n=1 Tax=Tanacetum cinerariifolium TaxID=118510 RepID=A0A6L2M3E3_TANCI|nr:hypothetical protein [Tanacetum cinerariifolium]